MFVSYECVNYEGYNIQTKIYGFEYAITDSEFGTVLCRLSSIKLIGETPGIIDSIIEEYEKRNLPVAPNLMKAILFTLKFYATWPIEDIISCIKQYSLKYSKYENDIEKYMVLI